MIDPAQLNDDELLDELRLSEDPDEITALRAAAAQRGLHVSALTMTPAERRAKADENTGRS